MTLVLPQRFKEKIGEDNNIQGCLHTLLGNFEKWLSDNTLEFFPEYTDHGLSHIQSVINTADDLITKESYEVISKEDIYVLISSILLHDCAMHLSRESIWSLLKNEQFNGVLLGFGLESPWHEKWETYKRDLSKYTESDWLKLFPDYRNVDIPNIGEENLDDNQKIIIGDFIRKYHANIAQVISVYGIPTKDGKHEIFNHDINYLNELAGFIARSHNYSLRYMVDLIGSDERGREYRNSHPCYLMGILRLADYLQFSVERTPKILFHTKGICSPVSISEWKKHFSILSTNNSQPDLELLFVNAYPEDASTLIGVKSLLKGFQNELDEFWAVTGEIYSRYKGLKDFGVIYRRVKSNIDNADEYVNSNHKNFHPELLCINSDDQKIYPLLVGPLYGKLPQIGLRELIQNSIDACNERHSLENNIDATNDDIPYSVNITIDLDNNTLTISDEGIGMDINIVKNYFLRIGASFRFSETWKEMHVKDGIIKLTRTGRFGIGMLAGFLIGDEISIFTRHIKKANDKAVKFTYKINSEKIEAEYSTKATIGTDIIIKSDNDALTKLAEGMSIEYLIKNYRFYYSATLENREESAFWYFLDTPNINLVVIKDEDSSSKEYDYMINKKELFDKWFFIEEIKEVDVYWQHHWQHRNTYCNGILVKGLKTPEIIINAAGYELEIDNLEIMVLDKNNNFPLNLTRNNLITKDYYKIKEITSSVLDKLFTSIDGLLKECKYLNNHIKILFNHPDFSYCNLIPFVFYKDEILIIGSKLITRKKKTIVVDFLYENLKRGIIYNNAFNLIKDCGYLPVLSVDKTVDSIMKAVANFILNILIEDDDDKKYWPYWLENNYSDYKIHYQTWLFLKKYDFEKLSEDDLEFFKKYDLVHKKVSNEWVVLSLKSNISSIPSNGIEITKKTNSFMFALCNIIDNSNDEFTEKWCSHGFHEKIEYKD